MAISIICIISLAVIIYAFFIEPFLIETTHTEIEIDDLPEEAAGLKICHISDIHCDRYGLQEKILKKKIKNTETDICVITGDIIHNYKAIGIIGEIFNEYKPRYGIYAIPGNGEHQSKIDPKKARNEFLKVGIRYLCNANTSITLSKCVISIIGTDDPFFGFDNIEEAYANLPKSVIQILLSHSPDILAELNNKSPDLVLVGHTHGGQARLPFIGSLWNHCRYKFNLSAGYYRNDELIKRTGKKLIRTQMYVNRGLSARLIHARFLCRPEIAILILNKKN